MVASQTVGHYLTAQPVVHSLLVHVLLPLGHTVTIGLHLETIEGPQTVVEVELPLLAGVHVVQHRLLPVHLDYVAAAHVELPLVEWSQPHGHLDAHFI